jgi:hypothetical protein
MNPESLHQRFTQAAAHPLYAQAMQADRESLGLDEPWNPLPLIVLVGVLGPLISVPVFVLPFMDQISRQTLVIGGAALAFVVLAVGGLGVWWMRRDKPRAPLQRVLCVIVSSTSNRGAYNPLTLILQLPDGQRFQREGLSRVDARMVAPGDVGVAFLGPSINGPAVHDFIRLDV